MDVIERRRLQSEEAATSAGTVWPTCSTKQLYRPAGTVGGGLPSPSSSWVSRRRASALHCSAGKLGAPATCTVLYASSSECSR